MTVPLPDDRWSLPAAGRPAITPPSKAWLITFADLAALLVAFFALMFSMGEIDANRWSATESAIDAALDIGDTGRTPRDLSWRNVESIRFGKGDDLDYLAEVIGQQINELPVLAGARIAVDANRLVISLPQALLFASARAELEPAGKAAIFALSAALAALSNDLEVVGHTDPLPVTGDRWPSNWELSLTRAAVVAHELRRSGYSKPIRISGAGSGRFDAVFPRLSLPARYVLARRVDIVVRTDDGDGR